MTDQINTDTKEELLTVRMLEEKYVEFQAAAAVRGLSMSSLVTSWAFQLIRDVKKETPEEFEAELASILAKRQTKQTTKPKSRKKSVRVESAEDVKKLLDELNDGKPLIEPIKDQS